MLRDIGIDLGTANILVFLKDRGIILNEPSLVALDERTGEVIAVGERAYQMVGRTPKEINVHHPLKGGVIADIAVTEQLLELFMQKLNLNSWFSKPDILICTPTNITTVEQKAIIQAAIKCGGRNIYLEEEPKVAAVGVGLDIFSPIGNMVIDIGGGTSDIAVLSMGSTVTIYTNEIYHCLKEMLDTIGEEARLVLEATPPELAGDIIERGVMVTGGGALINGIDRMLSEKLQVPVMIAENPLQSVAIGTGILLNRIKSERGIFAAIRRIFSAKKVVMNPTAHMIDDERTEES